MYNLLAKSTFGQFTCLDAKRLFQESIDDKSDFYATNSKCCSSENNLEAVALDGLKMLQDLTGWEKGRYLWGYGGAENGPKHCVGQIQHDLKMGDPVELDEILTMRRSGYRANRPGWLGNVKEMASGGYMNDWFIDTQNPDHTVWTAPTPDTECEPDNMEAQNSERMTCADVGTRLGTCAVSNTGLWPSVNMSSTSQVCQTTCSEIAKCKRVHTPAIDAEGTEHVHLEIHLDTTKLAPWQLRGFTVPWGGVNDGTTIHVIGPLSQTWCSYCAYWCASTTDGYNANHLKDPDGDGIYVVHMRRKKGMYQYNYIIDSYTGGREESVQWDLDETGHRIRTNNLTTPSLGQPNPYERVANVNANHVIIHDTLLQDDRPGGVSSPLFFDCDSINKGMNFATCKKNKYIVRTDNWRGIYDAGAYHTGVAIHETDHLFALAAPTSTPEFILRGPGKPIMEVVYLFDQPTLDGAFFRAIDSPNLKLKPHLVDDTTFASLKGMSAGEFFQYTKKSAEFTRNTFDEKEVKEYQHWEGSAKDVLDNGYTNNRGQKEPFTAINQAYQARLYQPKNTSATTPETFWLHDPNEPNVFLSTENGISYATIMIETDYMYNMESMPQATKDAFTNTVGMKAVLRNEYSGNNNGHGITPVVYNETDQTFNRDCSVLGPTINNAFTTMGLTCNDLDYAYEVVSVTVGQKPGSHHVKLKLKHAGPATNTITSFNVPLSIKFGMHTQTIDPQSDYYFDPFQGWYIREYDIVINTKTAEFFTITYGEMNGNGGMDKNMQACGRVTPTAPEISNLMTCMYNGNNGMHNGAVTPGEFYRNPSQSVGIPGFKPANTFMVASMSGTTLTLSGTDANIGLGLNIGDDIALTTPTKIELKTVTAMSDTTITVNSVPSFTPTKVITKTPVYYVKKTMGTLNKAVTVEAFNAPCTGYMCGRYEYQLMSLMGGPTQDLKRNFPAYIEFQAYQNGGQLKLNAILPKRLYTDEDFA